MRGRALVCFPGEGAGRSLLGMRIGCPEQKQPCCNHEDKTRGQNRAKAGETSQNDGTGRPRGITLGYQEKRRGRQSSVFGSWKPCRRTVAPQAGLSRRNLSGRRGKLRSGTGLRNWWPHLLPDVGGAGGLLGTRASGLPPVLARPGDCPFLSSAENPSFILGRGPSLFVRAASPKHPACAAGKRQEFISRGSGSC